MSRVSALVLAAALLGACERPTPKTPPSYVAAAKAFVEIVHPPGVTLLATAAGPEAAEAEYTTASPVDSVAAWYRIELVKKGWTLEREGVEPDGTRTLYATKGGGRPIWVVLRANSGGPGTSYKLIGVVPPDTGATR